MYSMNKQNLKKFILCVVFVLLIIVSVNATSGTLKNKSSLRKNSEFFSEKAGFDVLLFGSSHMELFVNPMELWKKYGITSYNFGSPEQGVPVTYWTMKNAINIHKPKVIVFDVTMAGKGDKLSSEEHVHYALDSFPVSRNKIDAVGDLLEGENERLEMFFTIGNYHNRWKELTKADFEDTEHFVKGSMSYGFWHTIKVSKFSQYDITDGSDDITKIDELSKDILYIDKMINMCNDNDIKLLFVANPIIADENTQKRIRGIEEYVNSKDVDFIDFVHMDSVVDYSVDMYDDGHVNQSGMNKVSDYLGSYIQANYSIMGHTGEIDYDKWNQDYDNYKQLKLETLWWMVDDLPTTLEMLHDQDIESYVFVGSKCTLGDEDASVKETLAEDTYRNEIDEEIMNLIQNIGRKNLKSCSEDGLYSAELKPLEKLDTAYKCEDYLATISGNDIHEIVGGEALEMLNAVHESVDFSSNDIGIVVKDKDSKDIKIIRKFSDDINSHEDFYSSVETVYF